MVLEPKAGRGGDNGGKGEDEGTSIWWFTVVVPALVLALAYLIYQIVYGSPR